MTLKELSDADLVDVLFQQFMLFLSAAGISVGRSMESALIESFIILEDKDCTFFEKTTMWEAFDEAETRKSYLKEEWIQDSLWLDLAYMPHDIFVCYVSRAIRELFNARWEKSKRSESWDGDSYQSQYDYFCQICLLLRADKKLKQFDNSNVSFSYEEVILEGRERFYEKRKATSFLEIF